MTTQTQPVTLVGMDLHSQKVELCIALWHHGTDPVVKKRLSTTTDAIEQTYRKQVPKGALTLIEATGNAFHTAERLGRIGYDAQIVTSDALATLSRAGRVNDRIDAQNLTLAHARGATTPVYKPSARHRSLRDILYGYRNTVTDAVRLSNRIWGFCNAHGLAVSKTICKKKTALVRAQIAERGWDAATRFHIDKLLEKYERACRDREDYLGVMHRTVARDKDMVALMQVTGIGFITAFALIAFIGDIHRFATAKKLTAYIGLNPTVNDSGDYKSPGHLGRRGNTLLRSLLVEGAQSAYRYGKSDLHKWARRKVLSGKHPHTMVCALARKMVVCAWHILMGHPAPSKEPADTFKTKLRKLAHELGKPHLQSLGYRNTADFTVSLWTLLHPAAEPDKPVAGLCPVPPPVILPV